MENPQPESAQWLIFMLAAAALHGFWLSGLIFWKNRHPNGSRLLGLTLIIFSLYLLNYLFFLTGLIRSFPNLLGAFYPLMFLAGPGFYFFVRKMLAPGFRWRAVHLLHLLPAILILGRSASLYLATAEYKLRVIEWILNPGDGFTWRMILLGNDYLYHLLIYVAAAGWAAMRAERDARESGHPTAAWLKWFSLGFLLLLALDLALKFAFFAWQIPAATVEYVLAGLLALAIHLAGYQVIGGLQGLPRTRTQPIPADHPGKYKTSPLTAEQIEACRDILLAMMKKERPYLDPELRIAGLADRLGIPSHHLSQVLNEGMDTHFYDFVNAYRVEAAKRRLKGEDYRHYSILAIGLDCGFTNKTTFNRVFKKMTGRTPSAFAREAKVYR